MAQDRRSCRAAIQDVSEESDKSEVHRITTTPMTIIARRKSITRLRPILRSRKPKYRNDLPVLRLSTSQYRSQSGLFLLAIIVIGVESFLWTSDLSGFFTDVLDGGSSGTAILGHLLALIYYPISAVASPQTTTVIVQIGICLRRLPCFLLWALLS